MANCQSTHTGAEIDSGIDLLDNNSATSGQVLMANGTGGATWQNASSGASIGGGFTVDYYTDSLNQETIIVFGGRVHYPTPGSNALPEENYMGLHNSVGDTGGNSNAICENVAFIIVKSQHVSDIRLT